MSAIFGFFFNAFTQYIIPFIIAIGIIYLIYGVVNYFFIGPGEEPVRDKGRKQLLSAFLIFLLALIIYGGVMLIVNFITWTQRQVSNIETGEETRLQRVPDTPLRND